MLLGQQLGAYAPSAHGNHWDTTLAAVRAAEQAGLELVQALLPILYPAPRMQSRQALAGLHQNFFLILELLSR